jgi:hypothetical protein
LPAFRSGSGSGRQERTTAEPGAELALAAVQDQDEERT